MDDLKRTAGTDGLYPYDKLTMARRDAELKLLCAQNPELCPTMASWWWDFCHNTPKDELREKINSGYFEQTSDSEYACPFPTPGVVDGVFAPAKNSEPTVNDGALEGGLEPKSLH